MGDESLSALEPVPASHPSTELAVIDTPKTPTVLSIEKSFASDAPPLPSGHPSHRTLWQKLDHLWRGLPTATKTTLVLAVVGSILLIAYAITTVSISNYNEEAHIATVIIAMAIFTVYSTFDAVIYENALQLVIAIILTILMLTRVLWFIATRPSYTSLIPLIVVWGAISSGVLLAFIISAALACRQFGWRLFSRLGVDYRQKDASKLQRLALIAQAFNALVKLDLIFLIVVSALGIDVAIEQRASPQPALLSISIVTLFLDGSITVWGVITASSNTDVATSAADGLRQKHRLLIFDIIAPLSFAGPIALIVIYQVYNLDVANASASIIIACSVFMATRLLLWWALHGVVRNTARMTFIAGRVVVRTGSAVLGGNDEPHRDQDPLLAPLQEGAWLGKPAPRNPRKIRFFQLSHDGSTLRWGWQKYVRLYYVQDVLSSSESLTLTLTFLLDPELVLRFPDDDTLHTWQRGLKHAMFMLMRPDESIRHDKNGRESGQALAAISMEKGAENSDIVGRLEEGMLRMLGMNIRRKNTKSALARSATPGRMQKTPSTTHGTGQSPNQDKIRNNRRGENDDDNDDGVLPASAVQLQKRQRMASFLAAAAAATIGRLPPFPAGTKVLTPATSSETASPIPSGTFPWASPAILPWNATTPAKTSTPATMQETKADKTSDGVMLMVSVGTQTDDLELLCSGSSSIETTQQTNTNINVNNMNDTNAVNAGLASEYAALMAAAAAASSASNPEQGMTSFPSSSRSPTDLDRLESSDGHKINTLYSSNAATSARSPLGVLINPSHPSIPPLSPTSPLTPSSGPAPPLAISVDVIDYDELAMGKMLGAGSEGAVYAAWYLETPVAVKRFNRVEDSLHEVGMFLGVGSHDNVVALRALCQHEGAMYLVLEYCPRGTLDAMVHHSARHQWDPARLLPLVRSIARGMHHLHSRGIIHRDLKPANIFIGHGQTMKVGDFGMARYIGETTTTHQGITTVPYLTRLSPGVVGTPQYAAPELMNEDLRPVGEGVGDLEWARKIDVWSFGVTLWEIMERKRPFEGSHSMAIESMWLNNPYQARLPPVKVPESLDAAGKRVLRGLSDLVEDCTRVDPMSRPTFGAVLRRLRALSTATSGSGEQ